VTRLGTAGFLAGGAVLSTALGFLLGIPMLFPFLGAAVAYVVFLREVNAGRYTAAFVWMLFWAVCQNAAVGTASVLQPERAAAVILTGPDYAVEMLRWVRTGVGPEGSPRLYLPVHARHFAAFCVLSAATFASAGLVLGTYLLNYMSFYVTELVAASAQPVPAALLGWPVWAAIRVTGFIACAVALAPLGWNGLARFRRGMRARAVPYRLLVLGVGLVVLDAALKAVLAPVWRGWLLGFLEGSG